MQPHAVTVPVVAPVHIECKFWTEDDGWKGVCAELSVSVRGGNFEEAKKNMEVALQTFMRAYWPVHHEYWLERPTTTMRRAWSGFPSHAHRRGTPARRFAGSGFLGARLAPV